MRRLKLFVTRLVPWLSLGTHELCAHRTWRSRRCDVRRLLLDCSWLSAFGSSWCSSFVRVRRSLIHRHGSDRFSPRRLRWCVCRTLVSKSSELATNRVDRFAGFRIGLARLFELPAAMQNGRVIAAAEEVADLLQTLRRETSGEKIAASRAATTVRRREPLFDRRR